MDAASIERQALHGPNELPGVLVRSYSLPLRAGDTFLGDLASGSEFREILRRERHRVECDGLPPFGHERTHAIDGDVLDEALRKGDGGEEREVVEQAVDAFSRRFAHVLSEFLETPDWQGSQRIVCGGGLMEGEVGRELLRHAERILRKARPRVSLRALHHEPDEAGMLGWLFAAPHALLDEGDGFLAVDIGGTNVRWGVIQRDGRESGTVVFSDKWRHSEETVGRDDFVAHLSAKLAETSKLARSRGISLGPLVGVSCPGLIEPDGCIREGVQNLPGDWTDPGFHLPDAIADGFHGIAGQTPRVLLHNDAVIQALSDLPHNRDVACWAAVTLGTGFGNASFRNGPGSAPPLG